AAALLIGAALCAFGDSGPVTATSAALAGALLGACALVRPAHALAVPVFFTAILVRDGRRGLSSAITLAGLAAIGVAIYLAWNTYLFGDAFNFGYPETADRGKRINGFETPLLVGLAGFLLSPGKSIFVHAPLAVVAVATVPRLARLDRGLAFLAFAMPVSYLLLYARYTQWEGGYCVGPRYLLPTLPFLLFALGAYLDDDDPAARRRVLVLAAAGALVQSVGLATSFLEDQFAGRYYDQDFNYRMGSAPLYSQSALLLRSVLAFLRGEPSPPLGTGFDRWFIFLGKAGVSIWAMAGVIVLTIVIAASAARRLMWFSHVRIGGGA